MNWFNKLEYINWTRMWWVVGTVTVFWGGLAAIVLTFPQFAKIYSVVNIFLSAALAACLFASRGTKYVVNRQEPPADGRP